MYKNQLQTILAHKQNHISILYAKGGSPLHNWASCVRDGCIKRVMDEDIKQYCIELLAINTSTCYIVSPPPTSKFKSLGISMPFIFLNLKVVGESFQFEITVLDDQRIRRRIKCCTFAKSANLGHLCSTLPLRVTNGVWSPLRLDLADLTQKLFKTRYVECVEVKINGSCRIRRIYFSPVNHDLYEVDLEYAVAMPIIKQKPEPYKYKNTVNSNNNRQQATVAPLSSPK